jgi:hypothetical protein
LVEKFAAYGFILDVPDDWRIEFNAKNTRQKGDVAFHSPANNVFFLSWGKLEDAQKRFKSLEIHRDETLKRVRSNPNVKRVDIVFSEKQAISSHEGIMSKVEAQKRRGMISRDEPTNDIWSVHFYCPEMGRYYVAYWNINDKDEYPGAEAKFRDIVQSIACHGGKVA